ncbi:SRPBCC family protein [Streptacidiphilus sp. PAMC 29251]
MLEIAASIEIKATPEAVWAVLADLSAYPQWNPFLRTAVGDLVVGGRLSCRLHPENRRPIPFKPVVLVVDPGRELCWQGKLLAPGILDGRHSFVLWATGEGTVLRQGEVFTGILVPLLAKGLRATEDDFRRFNEALRERVETREP